MFKRCLSAIVCCILVSAVLVSTACNSTTRIHPIRGAGSGFYVSASPDETYKIKELDAKSTGNYFVLEDYVVDAEGKQYEVLNKKKTVGYINLKKKSEVYNSKKFEFNLDTFSSKIINITADMNYVEIYSSDPSIAREIYINVQLRDTPLDITLRNANIYTVKRMPVLYNGSQGDINLILEGENRIKAGSEDMTAEEYEQIRAYNAVEDIVTVVAVPILMYNRMKKTTNRLIKNAIFTPNEFLDKFVKEGEMAFEMTKVWWESVEGIIYGENGYAGLLGESSLVSIGNITVYGNGNLEVIGGDGGDGGDASKFAAFGAYGGRGGDSGHAVYCHGYYNFAGGSVKLKPGRPGVGGRGTAGINDDVNTMHGGDGRTSAVTDCIFIFER